jgi:prefoldin subunit 5
MIKMECNILTARTHVILDSISAQATALAAELDLLEKPPSHGELNALKSKFRTLREGLEMQKRKTNSLDAKREVLVDQLKALGHRIWDTRESQQMEGSLC